MRRIPAPTPMAGRAGLRVQRYALTKYTPCVAVEASLLEFPIGTTCHSAPILRSSKVTESSPLFQLRQIPKLTIRNQVQDAAVDDIAGSEQRGMIIAATDP